jgi:elongation factor 1-beta
VRIAVSRDRRSGLAGIIARVKILPQDASTKPDDFIRMIRESLREVGEVRSYTVEPIAFGLNALVVDFIIADAEGGTDPLEEAILKIDGVGSMEVLGVSRASATL